MIGKINELSLPVVEKYQKSLVSVEHVNEYGIDIIRITIDDPNTFDIDIDDVAKINEEILDLTIKNIILVDMMILIQRYISASEPRQRCLTKNTRHTEICLNSII